MPSIRRADTVPANGTVENVLAGSAFEFAAQTWQVEIATTQVAGAGNVQATILFGPEVKLEDGPVATEIGVGQGPRLPDNLIVGDLAAAGDRLVVRLREIAGTATLVTTQLRAEPV